MCFCFSAGCTKCIFHISLTLSKPKFSWSYAFFMVPRFSQNMHFSVGKCMCFCFSAGCRKCILRWFAEIGACILQKRWKYALPHGKMHIFGKSWSHQICILKNACCPKMQIENAYFLRAIFTAIQKCIMDSGTPTFLIWTISPKAVRGLSFDLYIPNFQHGRHDFWVQELPKNTTQTSQSMHWNDVTETWFPFFDLMPTHN